jgi:hypothetical protein
VELLHGFSCLSVLLTQGISLETELRANGGSLSFGGGAESRELLLHQALASGSLGLVQEGRFVTLCCEEGSPCCVLLFYECRASGGKRLSQSTNGHSLSVIEFAARLLVANDLEAKNGGGV